MTTSNNMNHSAAAAHTDFPYYNGQPVAISAAQWLFIMLMVLAAILVVILPVPWFGGAAGQFIPALLMVMLPLAALAKVTPAYWTVIFKAVTWRDVGLMAGFALLNILLTFMVGWLVFKLTAVNSNPAISLLPHMSSVDRLLFFIKTIPQLLGEELITILPFLAILFFGSRYAGLNRKSAIILAWLLSSLLFALVHLPTYGWNWLQCILVIGSARLVLTLPWIITKNIWVSTGAHIMNDWLLFAFSMLAAGLVGKN